MIFTDFTLTTIFSRFCLDKCLFDYDSLINLDSLRTTSRVSLSLKKYFFLESVGHDPRPYKKQLSELRYSGVKTDRVSTLLDVIRFCIKQLTGFLLY